ncbi:hypothetical protein NCAS_0A13270 [Naumovozyma castellii]|uniref:AMP-activated protein kinase glycogen-binding domain-containing protein n=1 Tax=Naumovozyma castellii TaxID=27288 RepID=G0V8T6_NAUCA|nr:hypothetical protein NCAS_0A13270 [Naumovozyma castellii CBS 4309]CCC67885.1 hypothetical protein NCAS_0A13270 [Naumovozyma castellii CBS 4309]
MSVVVVDDLLLLSIPKDVVEKELKHRGHFTSISITGEFDHWGHTDPQYHLRFNDQENVYNVGIPHKEENSLQFKFIVDNDLWITFPCFSTCMDYHGYFNNIINSKYIVPSMAESGSNSQEDTLTLNERSQVFEGKEEYTGEEREIPQIDYSNILIKEGDYINISSQSELSSADEIEDEETLLTGNFNDDCWYEEPRHYLYPKPVYNSKLSRLTKSFKEYWYME